MMEKCWNSNRQVVGQMLCSSYLSENRSPYQSRDFHLQCVEFI